MPLKEVEEVIGQWTGGCVVGKGQGRVGGGGGGAAGRAIGL